MTLSSTNHSSKLGFALTLMIGSIVTIFTTFSTLNSLRSRIGALFVFDSLGTGSTTFAL